MRLFFYLRVKMTKFYIRVRKMIWLCKCSINRQFFSHDKYLLLGNKVNVNQNVISSWFFFNENKYMNIKDSAITITRDVYQREANVRN